MKFILVFSVCSVCFSSMANFADQIDFKNRYVKDYPNAGLIINCNLCHGERRTLNSYGVDYREVNFDFAAIEELDSDNDNVSNIEEIKAGTNPGGR